MFSFLCTVSNLAGHINETSNKGKFNFMFYVLSVWENGDFLANGFITNNERREYVK